MNVCSSKNKKLLVAYGLHLQYIKQYLEAESRGKNLEMMKGKKNEFDLEKKFFFLHI